MHAQLLPHAQILQPVVALIAWTLVMLVWMLTTRLGAMRRAGVDMGKLVGTRGSDADGKLPPGAQWKAHNYNHLLEQPVLFYALCIVIALSTADHPVNTAFAWIYVALRVAHSLVQATVNRVQPRFLLFAASTVVLAGLTLHASMAVF
jgi:hypothetical protein